MANVVRIKIGLKCQESGYINYTTWKNPKTYTEKIEVKKYS
ncbi:50S ribosomal protein L33, partial [Aliarcobacter butzleri]